VSDFKLPTPTARVRLTDGRVLEARVINPDYLRWDRTASKHGWPKMADAPFLWQTFLAWSALRREGLIAESVTWEEFSDRLAEQVEMLGLPGTDTAAMNGSSSADPTPVPVGPD
jgi:hypothetical protein